MALLCSAAGWDSCTSPDEMVKLLGKEGSERRWRLFACACCWRVWELMDDERSREAVALAEQMADGPGNVSREVVTQVVAGARDAELAQWVRDRSFRLGYAATAARCAIETPRLSWHYARRATPSLEPQEHRAQAALLRDLFVNPFRPLRFDPGWRTPTTVALAWQIYDEENFHELPILGDALEDAGCTEPAILDHCRHPARHVRGCWAIDSVLQRT